MTEQFTPDLRPDQAYLSLYIDTFPSPRMSVIASDFLHQLRAALDNLICALVIHRNNEVTRSTAFPIAVTPDDWDRAPKMWDGIAPDDLAILKSLQPVHRSDDPETDLLAMLRRLSNEDKHEALTLVYGITSGLSRGFEPPEDDEDVLQIEPVRDCTGPLFAHSLIPTELTPHPRSGHADLANVLVTLTGPNPQVRMKGNPTFDIALSGAGRTVLLDDLSEIRTEAVRVIERFQPAFH